MLMCMHILEISNLNYSETFDANSNVFKISSVTFYCRYRAITILIKELLLTWHCRKRCPQVKNNDLHFKILKIKI